MSQQAVAPIGQAERYIRLGPAASALDIAWGTRLKPRTPEEKKIAASERKVRHEDAVSQQ